MLEPRVEVRRHSVAQPWTYADLDRRQRELARELTAQTDEAGRSEHGSESAPALGALLLSEVAPVITVGRRTPTSDLLWSEATLAERGVGLARVDRGGLATYHGPGQWVVFAVDRLERLTGDRRGVRRAVEGLLALALEVGRHYDPDAEIRSGAEAGVWSARGGKFASVGVHIENGVLLHGLAINAYRTATSFVGLRPCGLEPRVDFLLECAAPDESARSTPNERFEELGERIRAAALRVFWKPEGRAAD